MSSLPEGNFKAEITLSGGTGKATIQSPADVHIENGVITAEIVWSSPYYDLMVVDGKQFTPTSMEGGSRFTVEIPSLDTPLDIQAETIAMSVPHMIDYTITVSSKEILTGESGTSSDESSESFAESSVDLSSMLESMKSKLNASNTESTGSMITVYSAVVSGSAKSHDFPPIAVVAISAVLGVVIAFTAITIGKKKK